MRRPAVGRGDRGDSLYRGQRQRLGPDDRAAMAGGSLRRADRRPAGASGAAGAPSAPRRATLRERGRRPRAGRGRPDGQPGRRVEPRPRFGAARRGELRGDEPDPADETWPLRPADGGPLRPGGPVHDGMVGARFRVVRKRVDCSPGIDQVDEPPCMGDNVCKTRGSAPWRSWMPSRASWDRRPTCSPTAGLIASSSSARTGRSAASFAPACRSRDRPLRHLAFPTCPRPPVESRRISCRPIGWGPPPSRRTYFAIRQAGATRDGGRARIERRHPMDRRSFIAVAAALIAITLAIEVFHVILAGNGLSPFDRYSEAGVVRAGSGSPARVISRPMACPTCPMAVGSRAWG